MSVLGELVSFPGWAPASREATAAAWVWTAARSGTVEGGELEAAVCLGVRGRVQ